MAESFPSPVVTFRVVGRIVKGLIDSEDEGQAPDMVPVTNAIVTFTPGITPPIFRVPIGDEGLMVFQETIVAATDALGYLVTRSAEPLKGVVLPFGGAPGITPTGWTWLVTVDVGGNFPKRSFSIMGSADGIVDLGKVAPVPANPGSSVADWQFVVDQANTALEETKTARDETLAALEGLSSDYVAAPVSWVANQAWAKNAQVIHEGSVYLALTAIPAKETFVDSDWQSFGTPGALSSEVAAETYVAIEDLADLTQGKADATTVYNKTASDERYTLASTDSAVIIKHGTNAAQARTSGPGTRIWIGSVYPTNSLPSDTWLVATQQAVEPPLTWFGRHSAATIVAEDLTTVSSWANTGTGSGGPLTQATLAKRPVLHVAGGGQPAFLRFAGAQLLQGLAYTTPLTQPSTLVVAVRFTSVTPSASTIKRIIDGVDASTNVWNLQQRGNGTTPKWQVTAGTAVTSAVDAVAGAWQILTMVPNGGSGKFRVNGVEQNTSMGTQMLSGMTVGGKYDGSGSFGDFDITDVAIINRLLTPAELAATEQFMADRCGVTLGV